MQNSEVSALVLDPSKAVKEYSRSSADQEEPLPHELRPPAILQLSMDYLIQKVMDISYTSRSDWFDFVWNRTRAIRKVELSDGARPFLCPCSLLISMSFCNTLMIAFVNMSKGAGHRGFVCMD